MDNQTELTGNEVFFEKEDIIVSKTDLKGKITYVNGTFLVIAGYTEEETLGQPHNFIRHPDMPRCIFKLLWQTLQTGNEVFAYVINQTKTGDHYWVLAHVTPSLDSNGQICGYHSNRRIPDPTVLNTDIKPLYRKLLEEEAKHTNIKEGMNASLKIITDQLAEADLTYDEFIFSLINPKDQMSKAA